MQITRQVKGKAKVSGFLMGALWSKNDAPSIDKHFAKVKALKQEKQAIHELCRMTWKSPLYYENELATIDWSIYNLITSFEERLVKWFDDKKYGLKFDNGKRFEPHKAFGQPNVITYPGVDRYALLIANETNIGFDYIASGTGLAKTERSQTTLQSENARELADYRSAIGNLVKSGRRFSKGIISATVTEFGGMDSGFEPSTMGWRSVIKSPDLYIDHIQGETTYSGHHTMYMVPVRGV